MRDYSLGKIYKMVSKSGLVYIGSTCEPTLARRKAKHQGSYKQWKQGKSTSNYITSYKLFDDGDVEIVLLESFPSDSKDKLHARERYYIENNTCVNKQIPTQTIKEYLEKHRDEIKQRKKEYHINNRDHICNKTKKWKESHIEQVAKYVQEYREAHKESITKYMKEYHEKHKEETNTRKAEKMICECGGSFSKSNKARHLKSSLHKQFIST